LISHLDIRATKCSE
jgi:hypothetical protein